MTTSTARIVFWCTVLGLVVVWLLAWFMLPERVPLHFGGSGDVDRWGSHTEAMVTMGVLGTAMALVFWGLATWVPRSPEHLLSIDTRDKEWWLATPAREVELRRRLGVDIHVLGAATMLLLITVELTTISVADDPDPSLPWWSFVAIGSYLVAVISGSVILARRRYRTPRGEA